MYLPGLNRLKRKAIGELGIGFALAARIVVSPA
jgi:hypothetical protein